MLEDLPAADEITNQVERLLRRADAYGRYPTPVDDLIEAARLQRSDEYALDESLISRAPPTVRRLLRSARRKIQGLLDRRARVVHISPSITNDGKRRFVGLHETVHDILPHQRDLLYADDNETLSPATKSMFEREANQGAAELLFQRNDLAIVGADHEISIATAVYLAQLYGSSCHAALRRYAETHAEAVLALVLDPEPIRLDPPTWRRHEAVASRAWTARFGRPAWPTLMNPQRHPFLLGLDGFHPGEDTLDDLHGAPTTVGVDTLRTPYNSFVLLWLPGRRRLLQARKVLIATED